MKVGEKIKELRKSKGLSQESLAADIHISKNALWNYENDKRNIPINILNKIALALNVELYDLIDTEDEKTNNEILAVELTNNINDLFKEMKNKNSNEDNKHMCACILECVCNTLMNNFDDIVKLKYLSHQVENLHGTLNFFDNAIEEHELNKIVKEGEKDKRRYTKFKKQLLKQGYLKEGE